MRKFDLSLRSSRSSYFATFRHQLTILSKTDALDEEKWLNMLGTFVKDSITTILKRRGCLTVPRLTLMSLIKMMLVMVSVAAISKTFGLLRFLLRLSFLAK